MSTQSFLVLFFLAAVVLTTPAIASDQPLRHKGCKPPKTGPPAPSPTDELMMEEDIAQPNSQTKAPVPSPSGQIDHIRPPGPENQAVDPLRRGKRCKPPKTGPPAPSPVDELMMDEEDILDKKSCKPPNSLTEAPVPSPKEQVDHIRPPEPEIQPQSHQLRHRKVPPSPAPSPAED